MHASHAGSTTRAAATQVTSPRMASRPNDSSAPLWANSSEPYPMIVVSEHSATAPPVEPNVRSTASRGACPARSMRYRE